MFNIHTSINRSRLKGELLDFFQKYKIQEQSDGKHIILLFPKGMQEILLRTSQSGVYPQNFEWPSVLVHGITIPTLSFTHLSEGC